MQSYRVSFSPDETNTGGVTLPSPRSLSAALLYEHEQMNAEGTSTEGRLLPDEFVKIYKGV